MEGIFITLEGPDGSGKTTALQEIAKSLPAYTQREVYSTREPGGSPIAEKIRDIILNPAHTEMDARTEALLYAASRRQHLVERVIPVLEKGGIILCDRFVDSSVVYQGYARAIGETGIFKINEFATEGMTPDLTLFLDVPAEVGLERIQMNQDSREYNRLDQEKLEFHKKVRDGYLRLAQEYPERIVTIDGTLSPGEVFQNCLHTIQERFYEKL